MTNQEINDKIKEIRKLEAEAEKIKQSVDAIKDELKSEMDDRKVEKLSTGLHNIFYTVLEQKRVDNDKLKAEGLYEKFLKKTTSLRFQITDVKVV